MPTTAQDIEQVTAKRKEATALAAQAGGLTAGARTFEDKVMEGVRGARAARGVSSLEEAVGYTTGQLASAPAEMRARLADVSPLQTDVLTGRQTGQTLSTLATLGEVSRGREGTIQEVVGAGTNRLLAQADVKRAEAERAATEAETLTNQIRLQEDLKKREFDEWEARERLDLAKKQEARLGAGGTGTAGEREAKRIRDAAMADAAGGLNSENFAKKYGDSGLSAWELINLYNQNSPYGAMEETPEQFGKWVETEPEGTTTQWQTIQDVKQEAYQAELKGASQEEINSYIRQQGFEPWEINYVYTGRPGQMGTPTP